MQGLSQVDQFRTKCEHHGRFNHARMFQFNSGIAIWKHSRQGLWTYQFPMINSHDIQTIAIVAINGVERHFNAFYDRPDVLVVAIQDN